MLVLTCSKVSFSLPKFSSFVVFLSSASYTFQNYSVVTAKRAALVISASLISTSFSCSAFKTSPKFIIQ